MLSADPHSEVLDPLTPTLSPRSRVGRGGLEHAAPRESLAAQIVSRPKGGRRFALREPKRATTKASDGEISTSERRRRA